MKKEIFAGLAGGFFLLLFYFFVMGLLSKSLSATIFQLRQLWYWIIILSSGFGLQTGLYFHLRKIIKGKSKVGSSTAVAAASGGTSAAAMIACCAHHLTDVLPLIGFSSAAIFLTRYQTQFLIFGAVMNGMGIFYMLKLIRNLKAGIRNE